MGQWRERLRFRRWGKWILIGGVAMVLGGTAGVEATSRSSFCNSCHIMEPYYSSWKHSAHKNVECVECHISPGVNSFIAAKLNGLGQVVDDVLNRTSLKPSASVSELSCTRSGCHTVETLNKKEINNDRFKFRHDKHLGAKHLGVEITCSTCHSHSRGDEHFEVTTNVCVTCHLVGSGGDPTVSSNGNTPIIQLVARDPLTGKGTRPAGVGAEEKIPPDACTACHDPPKGEVEFHGNTFDHSRFLAFGTSCESCHRGVTASPPPIDSGRCLECHSFGLEKALSAVEMHRRHTIGEHKIECSSCHGWVRHGAKVQIASVERFDCTNCHSGQHVAQRTNYFNSEPAAAPGEASSNPMFLAHVDCTGCHIKPRALTDNPVSGATVMAATPEACDKCHQAGYGAKMVPLWQGATRKLYDQVEADLKTAAAGGAASATVASVRSILDEVKADGSWGVHNPSRTQQRLEEARAQLAKARSKPDAPR